MDKLSFIRYEQKSINSMRESMAVLVVVEHPEKTSFTHSWTKESIKAAKMLGHQVFISDICLLYTSPSPRDQRGSRMPSSA